MDNFWGFSDRLLVKIIYKNAIGLLNIYKGKFQKFFGREIMSKIQDNIELDKLNIDKLESIKKIVKDRWKNARKFKIPYTPHDQTHSEKIESILYDLLLLDDNETGRSIDSFTNDEKFLLLAAVQLHDIGMCPNLTILPDLPDEELRKTHHERSAEFIKLEPELQTILTAQERDRLSTICFLHRKSEKIPDKLFDKIQLLIAYLRIADALHIPDRAPLGELRTHLASGMDPVSKYHWLKSFYITYAGPSKKDSHKLVIKFKKPINWNGNVEKDLFPLLDIIDTEIKDELDSVKDILVAGNLKYNLPVYTEVETDFNETYLNNDELADLMELLGIIELFNPTITPNSGKVIEIVLNQLERCVTIAPEKAKDGIQNVDEYLKITLDPLLKERPCHAYLWNIQEKIYKYLEELERKSKTEDENEVASLRIQFMSKVQQLIRALKWRRRVLKHKLTKEIIKSKIINQNDVFLLYGFSDSVILCFNSLDDDIKKDIEVFVCECSTKTRHRYDNKLIYCEGIHYINELKKIGIKNIYFVPDSCTSNLFFPHNKNEINKGCKKVNKVIFGTNGINKNTGEVFHGLGHLAIADMAKIYEIPIYVIAGGLKIRCDLPKVPEKQRMETWYPTDVAFSNTFIDVNFYNPREDIVPKEKITKIITEKGSYNTTSPLTELADISTNIDEIVSEYENRNKV